MRILIEYHKPGSCNLETPESRGFDSSIQRGYVPNCCTMIAVVLHSTFALLGLLSFSSYSQYRTQGNREVDSETRNQS